MEHKIAFSKTRIAPTPSGYLHLGNVLSFAITAALAEKTGAKIFLRIDDIDRERTNKLFVQDIFDTLNFLDIPWHEGPRNLAAYEREYAYMHRAELYNNALRQLKDSGSIFACSCSRADMLSTNAERIYPGTCGSKHIPFDAENVNWRLYTDSLKELLVKKLPANIEAATLPADMQYFVVRRKDGSPAYQLTSLVDDLHYGVDLVVRGEDLWHSTLAQLYLASVLGGNSFADTTFFHHGLIAGPGGEKLSKSAGATSIQYLRKEGKSPHDIYKMLGDMLGINADVSNWQDLVSKGNLLPSLSA